MASYSQKCPPNTVRVEPLKNMETDSVPIYFIINGAPGFCYDFEIQGCVYPGKW